MGARRKLNSTYTAGCVTVAGLFGLVTESWVIFFIALVILLGVALNNGDIRPDK